MNETRILREIKLNSIELRTTSDDIQEFKRMIDMYAQKLYDSEMEKVNIERELNVLLMELGKISKDEA